MESEGHTESAQFVCFFDKFFDALNVSSIHGGQKKRKEFRYPYRSGNDDRLEVSHHDICTCKGGLPENMTFGAYSNYHNNCLLSG